MGVYEEDLDAEAIAKCSRALSVLDEKARIRVFKFLLDKFEIIDQNSFVPNPPTSSYHKKEAIPIESSFVNTSHSVPNNTQDIDEELNEVPSLYELMKKDYTKNETEILLVLLYHSTNQGRDMIDRIDISEAYKTHDIYSVSRIKNLTAKLDNLIKDSYIKAITKTRYSLTDTGIKQVKLISKGLSDTKKRKPSSIKKKQTLNDK